MPDPYADFERQKKLVRKLYPRMARRYGQPVCPLHYDPTRPWQLVIAVILSAQCTDERVNQVTPALFAEFTELPQFYQKPIQLLEEKIYSTGFYKNKAKSIQGFARKLDQDLQDSIPTDLKTLQSLPGVGRKTANVVQNELFKTAEGVVVDTHVARISRLWGLSQAPKANAIQIERDLMQILPRQYWLYWSLYLIFLGREFCKARKPDCAGCYLNTVCPAAAS
ncbi:MAG: endonuclease III [Leptospiraceae bacterium]|nr:endonuclease III [Leptospiraceae bacterium]